MTHVAMTDHGNMYGAAEFYRQAKDNGITPVIGIEAYVAPEHRGNKNRVLWGQPHQKRDDVSASGAYLQRRSGRATTRACTTSSSSLAVVRQGLAGQVRPVRQGEHRRARRRPDGLDGCRPARADQAQARPGGGSAQGGRRVPGHLRQGELLPRADGPRPRDRDPGPRRPHRDREEAEHPAGRHQRLPLQQGVRHPGAGALLCIQTGKTMADKDRFKFDGTGYYIKSAAEMYASTTATSAGRCRNSQLLIADRVDTAGMFEFVNLMPRFPIPEDFESEDALFADTVWKAWRSATQTASTTHGASRPSTDLDHSRMGFPAYFLVSRTSSTGRRATASRSARPGQRGGSIVAYAMGITDLDPLDHGLIFERFLNPERISMPDIDIDFDDVAAPTSSATSRRSGAATSRPDHHLRHNQGEGRHQGLDAGPRLPLRARRPHTKAFPPAVMGRTSRWPASSTGLPLRRGRRPAQPLQHRGRGQADHRHGQGHRGPDPPGRLHAAGVIMSAEPLTDHIPVWTRHTDGAVITQFDYPTCEGLGLLKMDFLGLRNLTIMADAVKAIEDNGINITPQPSASQQAHLRAAVPRRHPGRVPVRLLRLPDPAAGDEAGQLRGHLRPRRAVPARPDGRQQPHQLRAAEERPAGDHPDPPRA